MGWLGVGGLLAAAVTLLTPREYAFDRARDIRAWEPDRAKALWFLRILPMLSLCGVIAVASTGADASASYEHLTGQTFCHGRTGNHADGLWARSSLCTLGHTLEAGRSPPDPVSQPQPCRVLPSGPAGGGHGARGVGPPAADLVSRQTRVGQITIEMGRSHSHAAHPECRRDDAAGEPRMRSRQDTASPLHSIRPAPAPASVPDSRPSLP